MTAEKPEAKKLREFWIDPTPDNAEELASELDTAIYIAMDKHPRQGPLQWQSNLINVREVSPALDAAYKEMERAVEKITSCCQACTVCASCELKACLEKLREARK